MNNSFRTFKLTLAYDGTDFAGWQLQLKKRTVQGVTEETLAKITGERVRVFASGRTDAGVHALGQVVSFSLTGDMPCKTLHRALNAELPRDVAVLSCDEPPGKFHARKLAKRKRYRYVIHNHRVRDVFSLRYAWQVPKPLDFEAMRRAAKQLEGTHDFASFETAGSKRKTSVRTIYELSVQGQPAPHEYTIHIEVEADGFLYNMVRNIVGTLVHVGQGRGAENHLLDVLAHKNRRYAAPAAPAQGLFLMWVKY